METQRLNDQFFVGGGASGVATAAVPRCEIQTACRLPRNQAEFVWR